MASSNAKDQANKGEIKPINVSPKWGDINSVQDALKVIESNNIGFVDISEDNNEDGFELVKEKDDLIGVPMTVLGWRTSNGDFGEFVSVRAITEDDRKIVFNDGSSGVMATLHRTETRLNMNSLKEWLFIPIILEKGLRASNYTFTDDQGKEKKATTHYLAP